MLAKTLQQDTYGHVYLRFPLFWKETVEWLKKGVKVFLTLSPEGDTITLASIPQVEKELED